MRNSPALSGALPLGALQALLAAALFGASPPLTKLLLSQIHPAMLASLLYLGSGLGLTGLDGLSRLRNRASREASLRQGDLRWLAGATLFGGILGPLLLMVGLSQASAASTSLLLNLEGVFTACLAWFVFGENFDRRVATGMLAIVLGGLTLAWPDPGARIDAGFPGWLATAAACLCWGIDNNLTQKVSSKSPFQVTAIKGLSAGAFNLCLAVWLGERWPGGAPVATAMLLGLASYGMSLALFVMALRSIGTARTGAYFSLAPFVGAILSILLLHESLTYRLALAGLLMSIGVWLHLSETHDHLHTHEPLAHSHLHYHDEHHQHSHEPGVEVAEPHTHWHQHEPLTHRHQHYPDIHHRHH
jgi:drug/metabolite transporter (DMT)-like permease